MELYRLRFNTANKSADEIKADYDSEPPTEEVLNLMATAYRNLHGTEVVGAVWSYSPHSYSLYGWSDDDDAKFKELIYLFEQDEMFGSYIDSRNQFEKDWESKDYESSSAMHFDKSDFEVIEKIEKL